MQVQPYATNTTMDVVIRKRVLADPTSLNGSAANNIGINYSYTQGSVFRLWTNVNNRPTDAVTEPWATCTVENFGTCTITIPNANQGVPSGNRGQRFWVVEEAPVEGSPAAATYSNPNLYVGSSGGPTFLRRIVGLTQTVQGNLTNYLPMTANNRSNETGISTNELPGVTNNYYYYYYDAVKMGGSFGAVANSYKNPAISAKCSNVNIAIVVDESGSIRGNWADMRTALVGSGTASVLGILEGKAAVSILGFSGSATWRYGEIAPVAVTAANRSAIAGSVPASLPGGLTNWDAALSRIAAVNAANKYDLVLFVTDGAPNNIDIGTSGTAVDDANVALRSLEAPIYASNAIKARGTRVVAVGVGNGATSTYVGANLRAISGETPGYDYVQGDWSVINSMLTDAVKAATCTVPIEVSKTTVEGTTSTPYAAGWTFAASNTGDGVLSAPTPVTGTTASGTTRTVKWDLNFADPKQHADLTLTETSQAGWTLSDVTCTVGATEVSPQISNGSVTISNLGPASGKVSCTFTNAKVQVGALAITKQFDNSVPSGYGTSTVFNGSYTCTLGENTVASGTWTRTGTGTASLTPASGSPAATQIPVGASCSATETQPTGSGGLPDSSWEWDTYTVNLPETIASNQTSTITVTNKAKRVYGNFQVKKVLTEGSTADTSNAYSGKWSCTLGSEALTGDWGPIAAGATWTSTIADKIPLGASCSVTSETRPPFPVAGDHSYQWDGEPSFSVPVISQEGDDLDTVTVTNTTRRLLGSVTWKKVDQTGNLLAGSEWTLKGTGLNTGGVSIMDCTSSPCSDGDFEDQDSAVGEFKLTGLSWGTYSLTEATPPVGYVRDTGSHDFTIDADLLVVNLGPIENEQVTPPSLPLTGGLGTDTFLLAGGGLLALAGIGGWIHRRRSLRVQRA